jgi:hypothetical protein
MKKNGMRISDRTFQSLRELKKNGISPHVVENAITFTFRGFQVLAIIDVKNIRADITFLPSGIKQVEILKARGMAELPQGCANHLKGQVVMYLCESGNADEATKIIINKIKKMTAGLKK